MRKIFSLLAAVLFAGSMMADSYTISFKESGTENDSGTGLTSTTVADYVATGAEYVSAIAPSGKVYNARTGRGLKFGNSSNPGAVTLTLATPVNVTSIVVSAMRYKDGEASLKIQDKTDYVTTADLADYTYTYATATEVSEITVGTAAKRGYVKSVTVNFEGGVTPPEPTCTLSDFLGNGSGNEDYTNRFKVCLPEGVSVVNIQSSFGTEAGIYLTFPGADFGAVSLDATQYATQGAGMLLYVSAFLSAAETEVTVECGGVTYTITVLNANPETTPVVLPDPTNCAEAAEAALSVAANNELYKDGAVYTIQGYVTSIAYAYDQSKGNMSFWMADAADGGNVLEAYKCTITGPDNAPAVGDKVAVTGSLTKYNTTPEFAAFCTVEILEHGTPVVPQNLGEKTIAEFLTLANTVDTCVITGVVANIKTNADGSYNKYGNFDLVDGDASVYVYGLLTAAGEAQKFQEMGVDAGDTLTVKAVYSLYNNAPQAKNAIFVEVKKYVEPVVFSHELYGSEALPVIDKTYFATGEGWAADADSHAEIVNDYDINLVLVASKASAWQSQVFVNPGFAWEVGAYYKMEFDLTTNHQLGGVHVKVNDDNTNFFYDSYPNDNIFLANQTTHYVADSIYAVAEPTNGGQLIFSVGWCDANTEILISNIVITKYEAPAEPIMIAITEGTQWLDATADEGWWQIIGKNEGYAVSLSNVGGATEAAGTYTIDQMDPAYTYVAPLNSTDTIHFTDGFVTVAVDAETEIVTVTAALLGTDGNTYDISMVYDPSKVDPYQYDEEVDDFEYTFESYIVNDKYVATNGILIVNAQSETTAVTMYLIPEEGQTALTAGEYAVAAVPAYGTVLAGSYNQGVSPSYAATLVAEAGQLYLDQVWYFVSGKVTVDANLNIVVDALNSKGKAIKATLKGEEQGIEDVDAAAKATKTIKNGQLIIEKNGVQYNAQGAVIR